VIDPLTDMDTRVDFPASLLTQRSRALAIASILVTLACSNGVQRAPRVETSVRDVKDAPTGSTVPAAASRCEQAIANKGLGTPEAAISLYVESIAANDLACALRGYAAHEFAAAFDFKTLVTYVQVLSPSIIKAPAQYPMFVEMNELRAQGEMADASKAFVYGLLTDIDMGGVQTMASEAPVQAFLQAVNPTRLATLKIVRIDQSYRVVRDGPKAQELFEKFAHLDGAEEMTDRIALYELSGRHFWSGFRLARYEKTWKIYELESSYGGPISGGVRKTTVTEYEAQAAQAADPKRKTDTAVSPGPTVHGSPRACEPAIANRPLATPEAAIRLYVESMAAGNLMCALQAYAAHEYAARFDFTPYVTYLYQFSPRTVRAPAEYPMFVEMNELGARASMANAAKRFVYGLLSDRDPWDSQPVKSDADIQAFVDAVNPARLATLKVVRVDRPRESLMNEPGMQAAHKKSPAGAEADEVTERIALFELSGRYFRRTFELRRYDKTWKIYEFGAFGAVPAKTTIAEYEARVAH
jgi:hypothetical protein